MDILVTNNPLAQALYLDEFRVEYMEASLLSVLIRVREHVHGGRRLLTHPLSGSVKPNETPYKSVLVTEARFDADERSVYIIGEAVMAAQRFPPRRIPDRCLQDLRGVDLSLIAPALEQHKTSPGQGGTGLETGSRLHQHT